MPLKNTLRRGRKSLPAGVKDVFEIIYRIMNIIYYLIKPFIAAFIFYFDLLKDCVLAWLLYLTLSDLSKDKVTIRSFPFETAIVAVLVISVILTQLYFAFISFTHSKEVFDLCPHKTSKSKVVFFRVLAILLAPVIPAFILANHVFYLQQEYGLQRDLQTMNSEENPDEKKSNDQKTRYFMQIEESRYKSQLFRRIYSFFRVGAAVIQSFTFLVGLILVVVVNVRLHHDGFGEGSQVRKRKSALSSIKY